eukprot:scaffold359_cov372-Pavlova_lutheri.AAC.5
MTDAFVTLYKLNLERKLPYAQGNGRSEAHNCTGLIVPGPPSRSLFLPLLSSAAQTRAGDSDLHA